MAQTQPVTIAVSCLDGTTIKEPLNAESVVAETSDEVEIANDDCVGSSSVEVSDNLQAVARNDEKQAVPQLANYTSVIAGKYIVLYKISFAVDTL